MCALYGVVTCVEVLDSWLACAVLWITFCCGKSKPRNYTVKRHLMRWANKCYSCNTIYCHTNNWFVNSIIIWSAWMNKMSVTDCIGFFSYNDFWSMCISLRLTFLIDSFFITNEKIRFGNNCNGRFCSVHVMVLKFMCTVVLALSSSNLTENLLYFLIWKKILQSSIK